MNTADIVDFCTSFNEHFPEGKGKELKGRWKMIEQRKFPLVYQTVNGVQ